MIRQLFERSKFLRLARHAASILTLICLAQSPMSAQARAPQAPPQQPTTQNDSPADNDGRGDQTVIVTLAQPDANGQTERPHQAAAPQDANWPDWIVAFFTFVLAVVACLQWWTIRSQERHMEAALAETKVAADAAKTSAESAKRTLLIAHRPKLVVRPITVDGFGDSGRLNGTRLTNGMARITNVGVLEATLMKCKAKWLAGDGLPLNNPVFHTPDNDTAPVRLPPGHFTQYGLDDFEVPVETYKAINNNFDAMAENCNPPHRETLYLVGYIKYFDEVGLRRSFFGFKYDIYSRSFESVNNSQYHYEE